MEYPRTLVADEPRTAAIAQVHVAGCVGHRHYDLSPIDAAAKARELNRRADLGVGLAPKPAEPIAFRIGGGGLCTQEVS